MRELFKSFSLIMQMIKVEHTLFGLPMAFSGMLLAERRLPSIKILLLIVVAFASVRAAAMTFNRIVDRHIDKANPRTKHRELPSGKVSVTYAYLFFVVASGLFFLSAYLINSMCFMLSPVAYLLLMAYSFTKRFTYLSHYVLGVCLGLSPIAGYIAVKPTLSLDVIFLGLFVLFWVAGFDIIYACQDIEFDRRYNLFSIPAKLGLRKSLSLSMIIHMVAFCMLVVTGLVGDMKAGFFVALSIPFCLLFLEHYLLWRYGMTKLDITFFNINSLVSLGVLICVILGTLC